jgi:hypothetical protein
MLLLLLATACVSGRAPEDADWWDPGSFYGVEEPVEWTTESYGLPLAGDLGVADLPRAAENETDFAVGDPPPEGCGDWGTTDALPIELTGTVTLHPRLYYKVDGCVPQDQFQIDSDEKYYGSFYFEDDSGGIFVLGDSKVAHFDMGDRVRLRVRGMKDNFGLAMVAVHDVVEIDRGPYPIHFEETEQSFAAFGDGDCSSSEPDPDRMGRVMRVIGVVISDPDTFGEFSIRGDDDQIWSISIDQELSRRGVSYPVGARIQVTAPVHYSYCAHTFVVMRVGQVAVLED